MRRTRTVEVAHGAAARFGEGPTWDEADNSLLWVDINRHQVHRFRPDEGHDEVVLRLPEPVAVAKPRARGGLVLSLRDGVAVSGRERPDELRWLTRWAEQGVRGNDAGIDPAGQLWVGTIAGESHPGWLARITPEGQRYPAATDLRLSNGIAWAPDGRTMYHVDTRTKRIDVFDYDVAAGHAHSRRTLAPVTDTDGVPDGLCTDADGGIWVALFRGGAVRRYTPDGRLDREIALPTPLTTACAFGGPGLTDLYVTSARGTDDAAEPQGGHLFVIHGVAQGVPPVPFVG